MNVFRMELYSLHVIFVVFTIEQCTQYKFTESFFSEKYFSLVVLVFR